MPDLIYGFHQLKDVVGERITDNLVPRVNTAVEQAINEHNRQFNAITNLFARRTTDFKIKYRQMASTRSQPLDENGRARPIKGGGFYNVAFPIQGSGNAWGVNFVTQQFMTVQDANDATVTLLDGDTAWMSDHLLAALFANQPWNFEDDQHGTLQIQPLANGDSVTYAILTGASSAATDNHYLAQAADISDAANPFPGIVRELREHPENAGEVVVFVASDLRDDIEHLATFKERSDPNIRRGVGNDELVGALGVEVPGEIIGYVEGAWIVEWQRMPSGYMIATTTAGQAALAQREYDIATLQGFRQVAERNDHPFYERQYARWTGFGGWNRVGGLVYRVGNASYAVPSGYASPMP